MNYVPKPIVVLPPLIAQLSGLPPTAAAIRLKLLLAIDKRTGHLPRLCEILDIYPT